MKNKIIKYVLQLIVCIYSFPLAASITVTPLVEWNNGVCEMDLVIGISADPGLESSGTFTVRVYKGMDLELFKEEFGVERGLLWYDIEESDSYTVEVYDQLGCMYEEEVEINCNCLRAQLRVRRPSCHAGTNH